jgi:hypothetical protein
MLDLFYRISISYIIYVVISKLHIVLNDLTIQYVAFILMKIGIVKLIFNDGDWHYEIDSIKK